MPLLPRFKTAFIRHFSLLTLLGIVVRLCLLPLTYHDDVWVNYIWGRYAYDFGLRGYYDWLNFIPWSKPNQPPISILIYTALRFLYLKIFDLLWWINVHLPVFPSKIMTWYEQSGNPIILKLVGLIGEILLFILIYQIIKKVKNASAAKYYSLLFFLNPALLYPGTVWGQSDSLISFLGIFGMFFLFGQQYFLATIFLSLCFLTKASLLIWLPFCLVIVLIQKSIKLYRLLLLLLVPIIIAYLVASPFAPYSPLLWLIHLYQYQIIPGEMPHLTANAFNLWSLIYGLKPISDSIYIINLSASTVGYILLFLNSLFIFYIYARRPSNIYNFFFALSLVSFSSFMFMTRMHERYLFPVFVPLLLASIKYPKLLKSYFILSITFLLNLYNMWWYPTIPIIKSILNIPLIITLISLTNLAIYLRLLKQFHDQE